MTDERADETHPPIRVTDRRIDFDAPAGDFGEIDGPNPDAPGVTVDEPDAPSELEAIRLRADALQDQLLRERADFANSKQRMLREQTEVVDRAALRLLEKLLPVVDNFERGIGAAIQHGDEAIVKGIEMVLRQLHQVLETEGLEKVEPQGEAFDPTQHEALASLPAEVEEPTVGEVVRPGYKLKGRVLRAAQVLVHMPQEG